MCTKSSLKVTDTQLDLIKKVGTLLHFIRRDLASCIRGEVRVLIPFSYFFFVTRFEIYRKKEGKK